MKVLKILEDADVLVADIEVNLGNTIQHAPTLCVRYKGDIIPLNTPDMRPILMNLKNAIAFSATVAISSILVFYNYQEDPLLTGGNIRGVKCGSDDHCDWRSHGLVSPVYNYEGNLDFNTGFVFAVSGAIEACRVLS